MQRIMIVGQPGSGKSTLARRIGARTGLPVFHIDQIHWKAGWVERSLGEKTSLCRGVHAQEAWIFEGGHSITWPERLGRCDTLIWLDLPVQLRLWRVLLRSLQHWGRTRPDLPEGCPERLNPEFLRWIWRTRHSSRDRIAAFVGNAPDGKRVHCLRRGSEISAFLKTLESEGPGQPVRTAPTGALGGRY